MWSYTTAALAYRKCQRLGRSLYKIQQLRILNKRVPSPLTFSRRIPARVISWQSYSSIRCRVWQPDKCSRAASDINGQLSNSRTVRNSAAPAPVPIWRTPSSVTISQCERLCSQNQHPAWHWALINMSRSNDAEQNLEVQRHASFTKDQIQYKIHSMMTHCNQQQDKQPEKTAGDASEIL